MTLSQVLSELAKVESVLHDLDIIDNVRPTPVRYCTYGCGCRFGTMDADITECACSGPCSGGDGDTWFSGPLNALADLAVMSIITLIHYTHDTRMVGNLIVEAVRAAQLNTSNELALRHKHMRETREASNDSALRDAKAAKQ